MQEEKEGRFRRQIVFDLDTKALKKYYPARSWEGAYGVLERFFRRCQFDHPEGTVYTSRTEWEPAEIDMLLRELVKEHPWLNKCMRDCKVSRITQYYSVDYIFDHDADIPAREEMEQRESQKTRRREKDEEWEL